MGFDNVCKLCGNNPTCHLTGGSLSSWLLAVADLSCFVIPLSWGSFVCDEMPHLGSTSGGRLAKARKANQITGLINNS